MKKINNFFVLYLIFFLCLFGLANCNYNPYPQGKILYESQCSSCHMSDGEGLAALIPPLTDPGYMAAKYHEIPCVIRYGTADTLEISSVIYLEPMPAIPQLTDTQISNIMNYINHKFRLNQEETNKKEVIENLELCGNTH